MTSANPFDRLAPFLREFIYESGWEELRPIQVQAINAIFDMQDDVLITAGTASGKTEAAFLPILSEIVSDPHGSVRVLYVGPLRALINDQFRRLEDLCEEGDIPVHRWHGDVGQEHKSKLIEHPGGVLQITPESIESLFINKTDKLRRLFGGLRFIVIDEVHTFLESDRGVQLRSQLERLTPYSAGGRPRRIGLSATVGDNQVAQSWLNPHAPERVQVIDPPDVKPLTRFSHLHFEDTGDGLPPDLIDDLYKLTHNLKSLIFCNSRREVEILTAELNRRCERDHLPERYLPHHGSISKEVREDAEARMKDAARTSSVVCTNTLELGIDIGQLDLVVQVNSAHSVMSFVQRAGRTGRRAGQPRVVQIYTTELPIQAGDPFYERLPFNLLKALAVADLFLEGWIEPPSRRGRVYNVLYHQILSRLTEKNGSSARDLVGSFLSSSVFPNVDAEEYAQLLKHLAQLDHIEQLPTGELIVGLAGERIVRSREFYAVFQTPPEWDVLHETRTLGRISPSPDLQPGVCLLLVGRVWEVKEVLPERKQVFVIRAEQARNVLFQGVGVPEMHPRLAERAREILMRQDVPAYLSPFGQSALTDARRLANEIELGSRNLFEIDKGWVLLPWTGTRAARTLQFIFQHLGYRADFDKFLFPWVMLLFRPTEGSRDTDQLRADLEEFAATQLHAADVVANVPIELLRTHKYDEFIPEPLVRARAIEEWVDWEGATAVLAELAK